MLLLGSRSNFRPPYPIECEGSGGLRSDGDSFGGSGRLGGAAFLAGGGASTPSSAINDMYSLSILAFSENVCIGPELLFPLT